MAAKAKGIAQGRVNRADLGFFKRKVQAWVQFGIVGKMVDGWRNNIVLHRHNAGNAFNYTSRAKAMACHAFG